MDSARVSYLLRYFLLFTVIAIILNIIASIAKIVSMLVMSGIHESNRAITLTINEMIDKAFISLFSIKNSLYNI